VDRVEKEPASELMEGFKKLGTCKSLSTVPKKKGKNPLVMAVKKRLLRSRDDVICYMHIEGREEE
jgi:hypothetical protein